MSIYLNICILSYYPPSHPVPRELQHGEEAARERGGGAGHQAQASQAEERHLQGGQQ